MGPSGHSGASGHLTYVVLGDVDAHLTEVGDDGRHAFVAALEDPVERGDQCVVLGVGQIGQQVYTYQFTVKGTELTGIAKGNLTGETKISDGKVDGQKFTFVENATYMEMQIRFEYSGTMTSADEIKMSRKVLDIATEEIVAKRVK